MADKYSYAIDRSDTFEGEYATREEAVAAAFADYDASPDEWKKSHPLLYVTTGRNRPPDVLGHITGKVVIEWMQESDDCDHELAAGWPNATPDQVNELTARLRATILEWLKLYDLEPTWGAVDSIEHHERDDNAASERARPVGAANEPPPSAAKGCERLSERPEWRRARASFASRPSRCPVSATPNGVRKRGL